MQINKKTIQKLLITALSLSVFAGAGVYKMMSKKQTYTASVNIRWSNAGSEDGRANDGTLIKDDIEEIRNADVLNEAITDADMDGDITPNKIAGAMKIEAVIPQEEQDKIDSALKNGKEYEYNPTEYKVTVTTPLPQTGRLLNSVARSFITSYVNNHVAKDAFPSDPSTVLDDSYDYIEAADFLRDNIGSMISFLQDKNTTSPDFRSYQTGYSFNDLYAKYEFIYDSSLPKLYADILTNKASKDPTLLVQKLQQKNTQNASVSSDTSTDLKNLEDLIKSYSEKNKANGSVQNGDSGDSIDSNHTNIMDDVHQNDTQPKTAYDELFATYNSENDAISSNEIDSSYNDYLISVFDGAKAVSDSSVAGAISNEITDITTTLSDLYQSASKVRNESAEILANGNISQVNTPAASQNIKVKAYALLAMVTAFLAICAGVPILYALKKNAELYFMAERQNKEENND